MPCLLTYLLTYSAGNRNTDGSDDGDGEQQWAGEVPLVLGPALLAH